MSIELLKEIKETEEKAEIIRKDGTLKAKQIILQANTAAAEVLQKAITQADCAYKEVLAKAEEEAAIAYNDVMNSTKSQCEAILQQAEKNMDKAISIIQGRIVKSDGNC